MISLYLIMSCLLVAVISDDKYSDKYDKMDMMEVLGNDRLLQGYADCLLDKGKCVPQAKELKEHVSDALQTGCSKCTDIQKDKAVEIIEHLIKHQLVIWKQLTAKYDPEGIWRKKYENEAKKKGIVIPKD